jgi:hypothetical protein
LSYPTDWQNLGIFPLQDHASGAEVDLRTMLVGGRITGIGETDGRTDYQEGTLGDVHPWRFWPKASREIGSWSMAYPSIGMGSSGGTEGKAGGSGSRYAENSRRGAAADGAGAGGSGGDSPGPTRSGAAWDGATGTWRGPTRSWRNDPFARGGGFGFRPGGSIAPGARSSSTDKKESGSLSVLPMFSSGQGDSRYSPVGQEPPSCWPLFPQGWVGVAVAGTDESSQQNVWLPTDPRLLAVNANGVPEMGTVVGDLDPARTWNQERSSRLQSAWQIVLMPEVAEIGNDKGGSLAMQFKGSALDDLAGWGLCIGEADTKKQGPTTGGPGTPGDDQPRRPTTGDPGEQLGKDDRPDLQGAGGAVGDKGVDGPPGPSGDGGGDAEPPGPTASGATWDPATGTWRGPVWHGRNDPFSPGGNTFGFNPGGGIRPGARGGGSGGGGITPCGAKEAKGLDDGGNVVFFLDRVKGWGPIIGGHREDKHHFQKTKDDQAINSGHLSVDALWYRDQKKDGPLDFAHHEYPKPSPLPNVSRVHLVWDPKDEHAWAKGMKDGKWKWFAEVPDFPSPGGGPPTREPTDPPPPPPGKPTPRPPGDTTPPADPPPTTPSTPDSPPTPTTGDGGGSGRNPDHPTPSGGAGLPPGWIRAGDGGYISPEGHWQAGPPEGAGGDTGSEGGSDSADGGSGEGGTVTPTPSTGTPEPPPPTDDAPPCGGGTTPPGGGAPGTNSPGGGGPGGEGETDNKDGEGGGFGDDGYYGGPGGFVPGMPTFPGGPGTQDGWTPSCHPVYLANFVGSNPRGQGGVQRVIMQRNMATGMAQVAFRPQTMQPGSQDYRHSSNIDRRAQAQDDAARPATARLEAFGAGQTSHWAYNVEPGHSQYRGGEAPGGAVFLPPYVDISDHEDDYDLTDEGQPTDPAYLVMGPNTCFAWGAPDIGPAAGGDGDAGGGVKEGAVVADQMTATGTTPTNGMAGLQVRQIRSDGTAELLTHSQYDEDTLETDHEFGGTTHIRIPTGVTAQRAASPSGGELRLNSDVSPGTDTPEYFDSQTGLWTALGGGGSALSGIISVYDNAGGAPVPAVVAYATTQVNMDATNYGLGTVAVNAITVLNDGTYEIEVDASFMDGGGGGNAANFWIETTVSGLGAWAPVAGSVGHVEMSNPGGMQTGSSRAVVVISGGGGLDIRVNSAPTAGGPSTAPDSRMTVTQLA